MTVALAPVLALYLAGCGTVSPGERSLPRWEVAPDPEEFGKRIHPILSASCSTSGCHGRPGSLWIRATEPLPMEAVVTHPFELPEALRDNYFNVLALSDLEEEEASPLVVWGSGEETAHPGNKALGADDRNQIVEWLEDTP